MSVAKFSTTCHSPMPSRSSTRQPASKLLWGAGTMGLESTSRTLHSVHPMRSTPLAQANVVDIVQETADTKTFVLQPDAPWQDRPCAKAGQHVQLRLEIDGQPATRSYSLTNCPGARQLALTVQRRPGGLVSQHLHQHTRVGDVLSISQPEGEFVLPLQWPDKILLLSVGIGITAVMAMLRDLQQRNYPGDLAFFHVCRHPAEMIFSKDLCDIEAHMPTLSLIKHFTHQSGPLTPQALRFELPDLAQRSSWMCGPTDLLEAVQGLWRDQAVAAPLQVESFATVRPS